MKTRQEMISEIIAHEIEVNFSDSTYIEDVLLTGMKGLNDMTDEEIFENWESFQED